jgi:hypothetical protein
MPTAASIPARPHTSKQGQTLTKTCRQRLPGRRRQESRWTAKTPRADGRVITTPAVGSDFSIFESTSWAVPALEWMKDRTKRSDEIADGSRRRHVFGVTGKNNRKDGNT